jgi:DnaJ-class molecular chaperone
MALCTVYEHLQRLGLGKKASKKEIRSAYHKLALQFHPDKNNGEGEEQFKEICSSYEILSKLLDDKDDNAIIDLEDSISESYWNDLFSVLLKEFLAYLAKKSGELQRCNKQTSTENVGRTTLQLDLQLPLEDIYYGRIKKIRVNVLGWPYINPNTGKSNFKQEDLYISLLNYKTNYVFQGKGDYLSFDKRGDVQVNLKIIEHPLIKIDTVLSPYDLQFEVDVCLFAFYTREFFVFQYFNELLEIPYKSGQKTHVIKGKGLPFYVEDDDEEQRGDLYIFFKLILPEMGDTLPSEVKQVLERHFIYDFTAKYITLG